jgi:hypothetical protein
LSLESSGEHSGPVSFNIISWCLQNLWKLFSLRNRISIRKWGCLRWFLSHRRVKGGHYKLQLVRLFLALISGQLQREPFFLPINYKWTLALISRYIPILFN